MTIVNTVQILRALLQLNHVVSVVTNARLRVEPIRVESGEGYRVRCPSRASVLGVNHLTFNGLFVEFQLQ